MNDLHHNCEFWAEPISLLAAGCLAPDEKRDVRRHFERCPDCRERFEQLTQLCGALAEAQLPVNVAENAIVERVMSAVMNSPELVRLDDGRMTSHEMVRVELELVSTAEKMAKRPGRNIDQWPPAPTRTRFSPRPIPAS